MPPRPRFDRRAPVRELPNINDRINYPQLRVVDSDGTQLGVISRETLRDPPRVGLDTIGDATPFHVRGCITSHPR